MIVVFGGSFNPPTIAHHQIAKHILKQTECEQFFFLPVGDQYPCLLYTSDAADDQEVV